MIRENIMKALRFHKASLVVAVCVALCVAPVLAFTSGAPTAEASQSKPVTIGEHVNGALASAEKRAADAEKNAQKAEKAAAAAAEEVAKIKALVLPQRHLSVTTRVKDGYAMQIIELSPDELKHVEMVVVTGTPRARINAGGPNGVGVGQVTCEMRCVIAPDLSRRWEAHLKSDDKSEHDQEVQYLVTILRS